MQDNDTTLAPTSSNAIATAHDHEWAIGEAANAVADKHVFESYQRNRKPNTLSAQRTDLGTFCTFLAETGITRTVDRLYSEPTDWLFLTKGLVNSFVQWMLREGYSIASINRKLNTVKVYARKAASGIEPEKQPDENSQQMAYRFAYEAQRIEQVDGANETTNDHRKEADQPTRISSQKRNWTQFSEEDAIKLKFGPDGLWWKTAQGRRDAVLMCLLIDHGLRAGEVSAIEIDGIDMEEGTFTFYREKVRKTQTHNMSRHTIEAISSYIENGDAPESGRLLHGSRKGGKLSDKHMNRQAISARVRKLGEDVGIKQLSAHDCRHWWATNAVRKGTDAFALRDAGGWSDLAMPSRYVDAQKIANAGVKQ